MTFLGNATSVEAPPLLAIEIWTSRWVDCHPQNKTKLHAVYVHMSNILIVLVYYTWLYMSIYIYMIYNDHLTVLLKINLNRRCWALLKRALIVILMSCAELCRVVQSSTFLDLCSGSPEVGNRELGWGRKSSAKAGREACGYAWWFDGYIINAYQASILDISVVFQVDSYGICAHWSH